jgi:excisionase family DNA binding protein
MWPDGDPKEWSHVSKRSDSRGRTWWLAVARGLDLDVVEADDEGRGFLVRVRVPVPQEQEEFLADVAGILRSGVEVEQRLARMISQHPQITDEDELLDLVEAALLRPGRPSRRHGDTSGLTDQELSVFDEAGIDLEVAAEHAAGWDTDVAMVRLLVGALTVADAAERLGVAESRVRQRLNERSLYGVKVGRAWRLPLFQFTDAGDVPNIGPVLAALPEEIHPLAVEGWITTPKPDLWLDGPTSPRRWLLAGGDPGPVIELARHVAIPV